MSQTLPTSAVKQFESLVKQAYQGQAALNGTTRSKKGVVGNSVQFPKIGKGSAQPRIPQTDVTPMNVQHTPVTCTLTDWVAPEYTDIFNQQEVNFDERKELSMVIAGGLGRRLDQLKIDAMNAEAFATTVSQNIGGTNTGANMAKLRRAKRLMDANGVPKSDRFFVHSAYFLEQLLGLTEVTSSDYNNVKALVNGDVDTFLGFKFIMIEDRVEGGLPLSSSIRTNFAYHKDAVGEAIGIDMRTEINYVPEKTSWLTNGLMKAGGKSIDTDGIIKVFTNES
jgi:hypothetical protein